MVHILLCTEILHFAPLRHGWLHSSCWTAVASVSTIPLDLYTALLIQGLYDPTYHTIPYHTIQESREASGGVILCK